MSTNAFSAKDIKREWHLISAKDRVLGRLATEVAVKLMGKEKASFVPYLDNGDFVVVTDAACVKVTGKKEQQKKYIRHSGYPGGYKEETLSRLRDRRPEEIIRHAVWGMLPKTRLGRQMIKKLHVFPEGVHKFERMLDSKKESEG